MGVDVQVFRTRDLAGVAASVFDPAVREHVSLHFYENPERYRILHLIAPARWQHPDYRFQLDYPEDLAFLRTVYGRLLAEAGADFGLEEVLSLLRREPELLEINRHCEEKPAR
jgi:spore coat polysaccharide biosynthesis protein SpsF